MRGPEGTKRTLADGVQVSVPNLATVNNVSETEEQTQPMDLDTGERIRTLAGSAVDATLHQAKGEHETEEGARQTVARGDVETVIEGWPDAQKHVARQMLEKYGPPNEATSTKLFWYRNGAWKRTELTSDSVVHNWPAPHSDFLTQVIDYRVPPEMLQRLAEFDGSILVDRTAGELGARCDSESASVVSLNMAHEIVTGRRTVEDARETLAQNKIGYTLGRAAPYAERLLFDVPRGGTEHLDQPQVARAIADQGAGKFKDLVTGGGDEATHRRIGG